MNFDLSDEQRLLQETVDKFLANECPPTRVRHIFDSDSSFDPDVWKGLAELGLGGLALPEQYGGAGLELLDLAGERPGPVNTHRKSQYQRAHDQSVGGSRHLTSRLMLSSTSIDG